ncbi:hypothetical protein [Nocardia inohanensis]|uniref:hypothetical protein n=1 Tax=Nocardia inohanensis TaxID=209246 RepID=UPI0008315949|nr:hypothetical protein [Nocardia inohanensis]
MRIHRPLDSVATLAVLLGAAMFVAVPACLPWLGAWGRLYGSTLIYLAFAEYVAVATGLLRWGVGQMRS